MAGPLDGIRVLDTTQGLAGPYCAMLLGDGGANAIKVERLNGDYVRGYGPPFVEGESAQFLELNRNKRGLALDIEHRVGRQIFERLIGDADVLLSDVSPARATEVGLTYAAMEQLNPRLVHCNITPFGEHGPMADMPGAELVVQGMAEYTASLGRTGDPPVRLGTDVANINTGGQAVQGVVSALIMRERTGEGQFVDVNMLRTLMHLRGMMWAAHSEGVDDWWGFHHDTYIKGPDHGYRTKDGYLLIGGFGGVEEDQFDGLLKDLGIPESVKEDPRWANNGAGIVGSASRYGWEVVDVWEKALEDKTNAQVMEILESYGLNGFPVNDYEALVADPQVNEIKMVQELTHPTAGTYRTLGSPWLFADTPAAIQGAAPMLGEHTDEVLAEAGYSAEDIDGFRKEGVIR